MDVRCEQCGTEYELDEARLKPGGVTVKCTGCGHMFKIRKRSNTGVGPAPAPTAVIAGTRRRALANVTSWVSHRVFPRGTAHDGTVAVDETRLAGAAFTTVVTDANGDFSFTVPGSSTWDQPPDYDGGFRFKHFVVALPTVAGVATSMKFTVKSAALELPALHGGTLGGRRSAPAPATPPAR